ncbi:type VII secretion integral membrane protein EccD [Gordonia sihwensis]|uniref:type VII secretion integral membrane protein EccD n=1 Tax=Gordonia sihwensis TaxID=173559 RepID=UPI001C92F24B|nr:type VII secretion integral membrane protein EccD [Gordonia sihwensis]
MTVLTEPDMIRTSIVGGSTQLDAGLPAGVPIAALMPDLLAALRVRVDDGAEPANWTLARIDGTALAAEHTLAQCGVCDGDLLVIRAASAESGTVLIDDVADGVAAALQRDRFGWSSDASRMVSYLVFLVAVVGAVPAGRWAAAAGDAPVVLAVSAVGAAVSLGAALSGRRLESDPRTSAVLSVAGCVLGAVAASLVVPGAAGGVQLALAGIAALAGAVIGYQGTGRAAAAHTAIAVVGGATAATGLLATVWAPSVRDLAAVVAAAGVGLVLCAPRIAIAAGRLPLPSVPNTAPAAPDGTDPAVVDGVDAVRLSTRDPLGAIADLALGDLDALARRAAVTASILTGALAGAVLITGVATAAVAAAAGGSPVALGYCACIVVALAARGRTHADRLQSALLVGAAGIIGVVAALAAVAGSGPEPVWVFAGTIGWAVGALLLGTVASGRDYSPPAVRAVEIAEYAALTAVIPLLLWVLDVYQAVRTL